MMTDAVNRLGPMAGDSHFPYCEPVARARGLPLKGVRMARRLWVPWIAVAAALAAAIIVAVVVMQRLHGPGPDEPPVQAQREVPGFRDATAAAGIAFRMAFLPAEQGEKFKI